ncbi:MAG: SLC13 family permease [Lachnospiraceae bacterium]
MNLAVASLIILVLAIIIGFVKDMNVGILCMGLSMILGLVYNLEAKDIISGFSSSLCVQMVGITYLFAIINGNGTLTLMANKMVAMVGKNVRLIPIVIFIMGYIICAVGPGAIPSLAIIPVLAVPIARSAGLNPMMLSLIGQMGVQSARMSPLTPEAIVVKELMAEQGIEINTMTIGWCMLIVEVLLVIAIYIYYKGWKVDAENIAKKQEIGKFDRNQILSIIGLLVLAVGVLFFSWNVGLAGFLVGTILLVISSESEKDCVKGIPWNVILMVLGVGILMNIITTSGGIDILVAGMETIMTKRTATPIMAVAAGVMSFFSSGLGVVFPTLIPTAGGLASSLGTNAIALCAAVVVGGTVTGFSPVSTAGALIMAAVSGDPEADKKYPQNKMFVELFGVAFAALFILAVVSFIGVFDWIC